MEYKLQAYDVHAESPAGHIHFQVLQKDNQDLDDAKANAELYLQKIKDAKMIGINRTASTQGIAPGQKDDMEKNGCFIYKIHGCPEDKPAAESATSE